MIERLEGLIPVNPQISNGGGYSSPAASSEQIFVFSPQSETGNEQPEDVFVSSGSRGKQEDLSAQIKKEAQEKNLEDLPLEKTIQRLNEKMNLLNRQLQFRLDERIGRNYISIIDKKTKETIKEFPPEEIRNFIAQMMEFENRLKEEPNSDLVGELMVNIEV